MYGRHRNSCCVVRESHLPSPVDALRLHAIAHPHLPLAKNMLHSTANTRLDPVHRLLLLRERLIPITLLANHRQITEILQPIVYLLPHIRRIRKRLLIRIIRLLRHQIWVRLTVMNCCVRNTITANQLKLLVYLTVILITEKNLVSLLRPPGIAILLYEYMRIRFMRIRPIFFPVSSTATAIKALVPFT